MKTSKKIFAVLLAVVLMFSAFAVCGFAAGEEQQEPEKEWMTVTITTDKGADTYAINDSVKVTVSIASNYYVPTFRFPILYDMAVLEPAVLLGLKGEGNFASKGTFTSNKFNDGTTNVPANYETGKWGVILVQWVGDAHDGAVDCINNPEGEVVFSFNMTVKGSAAGKTGTIFIPGESDLLYYQAMEDPTVATSFYYLNAETCDMTFVPANVTVEIPDVKLVPNSDYDSKAVVDEENLVVYGLEPGILSATDMRTKVSATGGSKLRVQQTELGFGTGTQISLTLNSEVVKTYTVVLFGDVDGDCDFTVVDVAKTSLYASSKLTVPSTAVFMSADISIPQDYEIGFPDIGRISNVASSKADIDQTNPFAVEETA